MLIHIRMHTHMAHVCTHTHRLLASREVWSLQHIDLTGCTQITDTALQRIGQAISTHSSLFPQTCGHPGGKGCVATPIHPCLKSLVLSRCHMITDAGLRCVWCVCVRVYAYYMCVWYVCMGVYGVSVCVCMYICVLHVCVVCVYGYVCMGVCGMCVWVCV